MNTEKRPRGRPRKYDEAAALEAATEVFWTRGFSATSLDDLANAMNMNRPSIYRAFGDKETIYRKVLDQFCAQLALAVEQTLFAEADVRRALLNFYRAALTIYTTGEQPKGCLVMSTAVAAATSHPEIQDDLLEVVRTLDRKIATRFRQAVAEGQLPATFKASDRAALAQAVLHSLSLRARAGDSKSRLERLVRSSVDSILA